MTSRDGHVITANTSGESVSGGHTAKMEPQVQSGLYGSWQPMVNGVQYPDHGDTGSGGSQIPAYDVKYKTNCDVRATSAQEVYHHQQHQQLYARHQVGYDGTYSRAVPTKLDARDTKEGQHCQSFPVSNETFSQHALPQQSTSETAASTYQANGEVAAAAESSAAAAAAAAAAFAAAQHQMQQFDVMQNCYAAASMQYQHQQHHGQHHHGKGIYSWMKPYGAGRKDF